jgi:uncharacterized membrane protein YqjE
VFDAGQITAVKANTVVKSRFAVSRKPEFLVMLGIIALVLLILWALALAFSYTMGGFIHVLPVLALVVIVIRVIQGRRT